MGYNNAINYLYSLQKHGIKLGLDNPFKILSFLENPQKSFKSIHVGGTNGKGSTSAMVAAMLKSHGYRVGLFTSPHLVSFTERIRINDEQITEDEVIKLAEEIKSKISNLKSENLAPTFFEFVTAMAFLYFKMKTVDWAVVEVGMGGRLDATNVIGPEVTVITQIGYDHKEFLGGTMKEIANEKAGIIKRGVPVISAGQAKEAEEVILAKAKEMKSPVFIFGKDFSVKLKSAGTGGIIFDYFDSKPETKNTKLGGLFVPLSGEFQASNAGLAIKAVKVALKRAEGQKGRRAERNFQNKTSELPDFRTSALIKGLASVKWPGRLEFVSDNPPVLIDGAHNPAAAEALAKTLRKDFLTVYTKLTLILGIMSDKDITGIMKPLLPLADRIILTSPAYERSSKPDDLVRKAFGLGYPGAEAAATVKEALEMAIKIGRREQNSEQRTQSKEHRTKNTELILITGSFYTIGEVKEILGAKAVLNSLRELP